MFRRHLLSILGSVLLAMAASGAPAQAQQSPYDAGVYDFTGIYARAAAACATDHVAYSELLMTVTRLEREFHVTPEYKAATADVDSAYAALDAARKPILAMVAGDPHYQELDAKYQNVAAVLAEGGLSPRDVRDLARRKMEYGSEMRRMEAGALGSDSSVTDTLHRLVIAQRKVDEMVQNFEYTLYKNPQWAAAKQSYDNAEIAQAEADGAVYGANLTACLSIDADVRHSLYNNNFGSFLGGGYPAVAFSGGGAYYGRRY